jgi:hypothetical protein
MTIHGVMTALAVMHGTVAIVTNTIVKVASVATVIIHRIIVVVSLSWVVHVIAVR